METSPNNRYITIRFVVAGLIALAVGACTSQQADLVGAHRTDQSVQIRPDRVQKVADALAIRLDFMLAAEPDELAALPP